jgi:uncharacterized protein YndB with AHSA1/START domain
MDNKTGKLSRNTDGYCIRLERQLPHSIETVWEAITDPAKLAMWFTDIEMEFVPGGEMTIYFRDETRTVSKGKIIRIEPLKIFEYSWEDELATWELFDEGPTQCKLILTYSKLPDNFAISVSAGWHLLLDQLEAVLNGRTEPYPFGGEETEEGNKLKALYRDIAGKEFPELLQ